MNYSDCREPLNCFAAAEKKMFRKLTSPARIQRFLDCDIGYNLEPDGDTCRSPRLVLRDGIAHCMEGALIAAAALRWLGYPPLIVDLEAVRDSDHVLAVYRIDGHWGAVAKSDYAGLRSREPVYRTVRELVMSYFDHYYNPGGEKTLRGYSRPVNLARFDRMGWMTAERDVWEIPNHLCDIPHTKILTRPMERRLAKMDERLYRAGRVGGVAHPPARKAVTSISLQITGKGSYGERLSSRKRESSPWYGGTRAKTHPFNNK